MKRLIVTVTATIAGLVGLLSFKSQSDPVNQAESISSRALKTGANPTSAATDSAAPSASSAGAASTTAGTKSYTGSAITTRYGVIQVQVTMSGSNISDVSYVQLTAFDRRSQDINSYAAPILVQETLNAQSARIDTVSGATYTSDGYMRSLQSALDQAK